MLVLGASESKATDDIVPSNLFRSLVFPFVLVIGDVLHTESVIFDTVFIRSFKMYKYSDIPSPFSFVFSYWPSMR